MKIWKKNLIAAAVLVTVCAGIYINWLYSEEQYVQTLTDTLDSGKLLSTDMVVMGGALEGVDLAQTDTTLKLRSGDEWVLLETTVARLAEAVR